MGYTNARGMMSDAKFFEAYSRYDESLGRYETWNESVERVMEMHREYYADKMTAELDALMKEVETAYKDKLFLGAQRALQFGGEQLLKHHARLYNCTASYADRPAFFGEAFYLMLSGCGVGFSVQKHHVAKLPEIRQRTKTAKTFVVPDSVEGWATSLDVLLSSFFVGGGRYPEYEGKKVNFDLTEIRPKNALISGGFKAPGPEVLRVSLDKIERILKECIDSGRAKLKPIEIYDIVMHVADAVISGGVRRSATICLFSADDEEMITAKTGSWFVDNPQRGRSNNSAVLLRGSTSFEQFSKIMESVKHSGEPGFIWVDDLDIVFNPCVEISMIPQTADGKTGFQMCNLTEINGGKSHTKEIFLFQCKVASIMGTLQAGYTNFKYLSPESKEIVDREALIGVGITGWMNNPSVLFDKQNMKDGAEEVKKWNKVVANLIGINPAARTTCVKPSGNASTILGTASGIHGEHSPLYLRHVQFNKDTEVAKHLIKHIPSMIEKSVWARDRDIVVAFPVVSPETSVYKKDLLGVKQLEYVKLAQENWVEHGTNVDLCVRPYVRHNVSNTITVDDWDEVTKYIYENRNAFCGVSLLSASGDRAYPQAPFTEVYTQEQIIEMYGEVSMFASGLIERGLKAFNNDLWTACNTALGYGEKLTDAHKDAEKNEFVKSFKKFAVNFLGSDLTEDDYISYNSLKTLIKALRHAIAENENKIDSILSSIEILEIDESDEIYEKMMGSIKDFETHIAETKESLEDINDLISQTKVFIAKANSRNKCSDCLKDVYNLHKWWRIQKNIKNIEWASELSKKEFVDIGTLGAQACSGGACEVTW